MTQKLKNKVPIKNQQLAETRSGFERSVKELVNFSFSYLEENHPKFPFRHEDVFYYMELLKRLKAVNTLKLQEVLSNRSNALRAHPIKWDQTTEPGFGLPAENTIAHDPYQLSIGANKHGRLHGFFVFNTFFVVWLDKHHALYS